MAKPHPKVDAVIIGVGWVGGIIASELTKAGPQGGRARAWHQARRRRLPGRPRRARLRDPLRALPGHLEGDLDAAPQPARDGAADPPARLVPARHRARRRGRALERPDLALPSARLHDQDEHDRPLRRGDDPGRHDDPGLGHHLRRDGAVLPDVRGHGRHRRQGGQPERQADPGRQRLRGAALARSTRSGRSPTRTRARSCARRRSSSATTRSPRPSANLPVDLQEPRRRHARPVHLLRVLRALRLRGRARRPTRPSPSSRWRSRRASSSCACARTPSRSRTTARRRRASSTTTRTARSRSSRPTSSSSRRTCSTTRGCC